MAVSRSKAEYPVSRRFRLFLNIYGLLVFVGIGGLQMYRVHAGILTDYGADLLAPPFIYFSLRGGRFHLRPLTALTLLLGGCFLWELSQRYDFSGTPLALAHGTFDPYDLLSYVLGLTAAYSIDQRWLIPNGAFIPPGAPPGPSH